MEDDRLNAVLIKEIPIKIDLAAEVDEPPVDED
jgi:hypothetical protein